jgi:predicted transcriptional regulator
MVYTAAATGEYVAAGLTDLTERLATETRLREVSEWLPTEDVGIGIGDLSSARITTPSQTRPNAPIQRMLDLLGATDSALLLSHAFNGQKLQLVRDRTVEGDLTTRGVFGESAIDAITETAELRDLLVDVVESPDAEIRMTPTEVPVAVEVTDDRTHLLLRDEDGIVRAALDTDDERVRTWATELHEEFWTDATPVTPATLQ